MAILDIVIAPAKVLSTKAEPVKEVNEEIKTLLGNMLETMYADKGVGLAGPQVGISKRVVVMDVSSDKTQPLLLVNPEIINKSEEICLGEEGCLSVPGLFADVERYSEVEVKYLDENGKEQTLKADGLLAVCIQHELDHLNGVMFYDRISRLRKNMILKKLKKSQK